MDEFLPIETLGWCSQALAEIGIDLATLCSGDIDAHGNRLHTIAYHYLRQRARSHIDGKYEPVLGEISPLASGYGYYEELGGAVGRLIWENAELVAVNSGEIQPLHDAPVLRENEEIHEGWDVEDLGSD
jgi:hypothetical protein